MSPRRNYPKNKRPKSDERDITTSNQTIEEHHEGMYIVRKLTGSSSNKPYRCPGCDQMIPMATPHTVAWIEDVLEVFRVLACLVLLYYDIDFLDGIHKDLVRVAEFGGVCFGELAIVRSKA